MARITVDLVRKRSEHNEGEISTLEEIALHQENIDRIEGLDKWCHDLKILLLQSNLISKIENVSRLKKLEYLNLALNNIERIENLEGCESLKKVDLTVNFIGELTGIETLRNNIHLESLYLTGNPCTNFEGYRKYVIVTLPQLKNLDGQEIGRSERILAAQEYEEIKTLIVTQERQYKVQRVLQRDKAKQRIEEEETRWSAEHDKSEEDKLQEFWSEVSDHSPETRVQIAEHILKQQRQKQKEQTKPPKREYKLFKTDGKPLNVNEAKIPFVLTEDDDTNSLVLDIAVYKYLDTSLLEVDIQPMYVRVLIKGKIFQIVFPDEIKTDSSTAQRSQVTGHLVLTMPKSAISNRSSSGNQHTFSALWYASHLPFRATASKTVVLLQCTLCQEREDEYGNMISMLLENDITLHVLQPFAFQMHSGQSKAKKVYGMDLHGAFSGHNLKSLTPSLPLLRQVMLPKDLCTSLALEVNGTLFNLHHLLHNDHGTYRLVKKFIDVWARRVTLTAKPSLCQKCRCMANQDEVGQLMCFKCLSPSTEHFLKEWEI